MIYLSNVGQLIREIWGGSRQEGSFKRNYLAVLSGTGLNIIVQIFVSPILTRLYGPEAYGVYALFSSVCVNLGMVSTLRFPQAFLLPPDQKAFEALMRLSFISSFSISIGVATVVFWNGEALLASLQAETLLPYIWLIPVMVFLVAVNHIFGQWQYRLNAFQKSVVIDTSLLIAVRTFNLGFGWLSHGMRIGLVLGDVLGKTLGIILSAQFIIKEELRSAFKRISFSELKKVFLTYKAYPFVNLPGVWLILTSEQLPFFLLSSRFGLTAIGFLALSISILDLPKRLFAYSVSSVFYKRAVDLHAQSFGLFQVASLKMFHGLLVLSIVPYSMILIFGPALFSLVFGSDWQLSGTLAQYLALYYVLELICVSFDSIFYILRKEKSLFFFQVSAFVGRFGVLVFAYYQVETLEKAVAGLVGFNILLYSAQLFVIFRFLKLPALRYLLQVVGLMAVLVSVLGAIKLAWNYL